ncbi:hypothetical protein MWU76_03205, partial [Gelidibacter sp. F2691]|nr:hypothetical protein [Gelidibacter sp. F2691]
MKNDYSSQFFKCALFLLMSHLALGNASLKNDFFTNTKALGAYDLDYSSKFLSFEKADKVTAFDFNFKSLKLVSKNLDVSGFTGSQHLFINLAQTNINNWETNVFLKGRSNYQASATSTVSSSNMSTEEFTNIYDCSASVLISSNATNDTFCAGAAVTFTAAPDNEGSNPLYQWRVNAVNVGTKSSTKTYTPNPNTLKNGDVVSVELTSDIAGCGVSVPILSNAITVTVNPIPVVTTTNITTICSGTSPNISLNASVESSFSWIVGTVNGSITGASGGSGSTINQTLTNPSTTTSGTVEYIVTPTSDAGGCEGAPYTITVTVNPKPVVSNTTPSTAT